MSLYTGKLACVRCQTRVEDDEPWTGCATCRAIGIPSNVLPVYDLSVGTSLDGRSEEPGIFRYRQFLPMEDTTKPVSLFEGGTPLVPADALAAEVGVRRLLIKDETRNPTWSFKDRLAALAVTNARERGAETVALATTGNHGAAGAAYAAAAGLRCVVLTLASVPGTMKVLMQSYGAQVVALPSGPERWELLAAAVQAWRWIPLSGFIDPPIGSNPFGVDGYKTIAYELHEQLAEGPDAVVIPTAYGDGLAGIERGFQDLLALGAVERVPRMVATDPFGAYAAALAADDEVPTAVETGPTVSFSVAAHTATQQGLTALRRSGGTAVAQPDDKITLAAQRRIAATTGLFLEPSSALVLPAVEQLVANGALGLDDVVVCIATSSGLKDIEAAQQALDDVVVIPPDLERLRRVVEAG